MYEITIPTRKDLKDLEKKIKDTSKADLDNILKKIMLLEERIKCLEIKRFGDGI